jgi:hypothetical protein
LKSNVKEEIKQLQEVHLLPSTMFEILRKPQCKTYDKTSSIKINAKRLRTPVAHHEICAEGMEGSLKAYQNEVILIG